MSKVNPYIYYSDFDQAWLGELPSHWQVMRTKLLFDLVTEFAPVGNSEELLSVYTAIGVKPRKELEARGNKASSTDNYWRVQQGDIIVNKLLAWMGAIGISEYNGVTSPAYDILRPKENVNPYYYNFLFRNPIASREFKRHSRGIMDMRLRLYFTRFGDIKLPLPPMEEQVKIVEYLQFKLKKIDRFIRKKKQLIKLLNEQKASIINNAVTKGLNPKAKMNSSGIEWLGEIPEHWEVKKLKYSVRLNIHKELESVENSEIKIALENIESKTGRILEFSTNPFEGIGTIFKPGDVLFGKLRPYLAKVIAPDFEGSCVNEILVLSPNQEIWHSVFLKYRMLSSDFIGIVDNSTYGAKMPRASWNFIGDLKISCPPKNEQIEITDTIEEEHKEINYIISTIEKEIALTQEYRTALIAEAVTGKVDVRDFVIPEEKEEEIYEELEEELSLAAEGEAEYETDENPD